MARVALPASKVRLRRQRRRIIAGAVLCGALAVVCGALVWLSHAPFLRVDHIVAGGLRTVKQSSIETTVRTHLAGTYGYLFAKDNILLYPKNEITQALAAKYPQFKVVEVSAIDFSTLAVNVVEREPKALWCDSRCYYMDEDGVVYAEAAQKDSAVFVAYRGSASGSALPKQYLQKEEFHTLSAFAGAIAQQESAERLVGAAVDAAGDVRLSFESGFVLMFPLREPSGDVYERYALARDAEPFKGRPLSAFEYLDLRFGDKLYYKERQ